MIVFEIGLLLACSYLFGSIPWGFIIGKLKGIDIRKQGSNNIGATNVTRLLGKPLGYTCFVLDFLKGFLPSYLMMFVITLPSLSHENGAILAILGTFFGHLFPIYLKFKGGKGVATGTGALLAISPIATVCGLIMWAIIFKATRYVSLASIVVSITVPVLTILFSLLNIYHVSVLLQFFVSMIGAVAIIKHRSNISRLINGTEYRFERKNKQQK